MLHARVQRGAPTVPINRAPNSTSHCSGWLRIQYVFNPLKLMNFVFEFDLEARPFSEIYR